MILKCERAELIEAVKTSVGAVAASPPVEALKCLLIEAADNKIHITGYNLKTAIKSRIDAETIKEGRILLNAKIFKGMVEKLPEGLVELSDDEGLVTLRCGKVKYDYAGMNADEFPELPQADIKGMFGIDSKELGNMLGCTLYAASTDEARPIFTGELFDVQGEAISVVATNAYCLAQCRGRTFGAGAWKFVVPADTLKFVKDICKTTGNVFIADCEKHVIFRTESVDIITRKLDGEFLNPDNVFPKEPKQTVFVSRKEALKSVERISVLEDAGGRRSVYMTFDDGLVTCANNTSTGSATDSFECKGNGASIRIRFDSRLLIPTLKAIPGDELKIQFSAMNAPVAISTDSDEGFRCLILPVRQNREAVE